MVLELFVPREEMPKDFPFIPLQYLDGNIIAPLQKIVVRCCNFEGERLNAKEIVQCLEEEQRKTNHSTEADREWDLFENEYLQRKYAKPTTVLQTRDLIDILSYLQFGIKHSIPLFYGGERMQVFSCAIDGEALNLKCSSGYRSETKVLQIRDPILFRTSLSEGFLIWKESPLSFSHIIHITGDQSGIADADERQDEG